MVLAGGAKAYKTWLLTDQGFSTANELPWLGFKTARTKTLYIDFELMKFDFEQRMARIRAVKAGGISKISAGSDCAVVLSMKRCGEN